MNPRVTDSCDGPEGLEEGIEFAMRANTSGMYGPWVPLRLTWRDSVLTHVRVRNIRGYNVETRRVASPMAHQEVAICGEDLPSINESEVQFRWMNTADEPGRLDMWALFNVTANYLVNGNTAYTFDTRDSE